MTDMLTSAHRTMLEVGSKILPEVIAERGWRSLSGYGGSAELKRLAFADVQRRVPGLLIPVHTTDGQVLPMVWRPDAPRILTDERGKVKTLKYDQAEGSDVRLDCPPRCRPQLLHADTPLWVTEGYKKGDCLASQGLCVIDLPGVWGFRVPKKRDPAQPPLPDWKYVQLADRTVTIVFDSDVTDPHKPDIAQARTTLARFLTSRGARVQYCTLPALPSGEKCGVDDYVAMGQSLTDLEALAQAPPASRSHAIRISARAIKAEVHPPLNFVVDEVLPAGCTLMTGKSKDGKSMMAYNLAVAVASGARALGTYATMAGSVWYLALEDGKRRAQKRLELQEAQMGPLPDEAQDRLEFTLWDAPRLGEGLEEDIRTWIETTPDARLCIIDILEKVRPPRKLGGSTYAEDYTATSSLTKLAEAHNVAILILHHSNKSNPADFRDSASGAMSLVGGADNFWSLSRQPLSEDATLKVTGRDIPHEYDLAMQFKDGYWTALGEMRLVVMSTERQAIVAALLDQRRPMTPKQLATATGKNYTTTKMLLAKMLAATVVMQPTEGHYALSPTYLSSLQPEKKREREENAVDPVDSVDCIDSVDPIDSRGKDLEKQEVSGHDEDELVEDQPPDAPEGVYGESTGVYGESTAANFTQPLEKIELNGGTVYGSTESMGFIPFAQNGASAPDCLPPPCLHPETTRKTMEDGSCLLRCATCHRILGVTQHP